jgi:hypothetical protein
VTLDGRGRQLYRVEMVRRDRQAQDLVQTATLDLIQRDATMVHLPVSDIRPNGWEPIPADALQALTTLKNRYAPSRPSLEEFAVPLSPGSATWPLVQIYLPHVLRAQMIDLGKRRVWEKVGGGTIYVRLDPLVVSQLSAQLSGVARLTDTSTEGPTRPGGGLLRRAGAALRELFEANAGRAPWPALVALGAGGVVGWLLGAFLLNGPIFGEAPAVFGMFVGISVVSLLALVAIAADWLGRRRDARRRVQ